jgi:hypothetical protein
MTRSIDVALEDLKLKKIYVIYPGKERYPLHAQVEALPLTGVPGLKI